MKHTPGSWEFDGEDFIFAKPMREGRMIAQVRGWGWLQYKGEDAAIAEQKANGFLLAAAPDLLKACKAALGAFEHNNAIDWDELERAIAAAEGTERQERGRKP